ncbi:transposase, partial [Acinetobacter baumannii]
MDNRYRKNAGAVYSLKYHLVFCPKYRRPVLVNGVDEALKQLIQAKAEELGIT